MSSKKIYLIRHGQTDFNLQNIVQGSGVDSDLNATGRAQAKAFFDNYKQIPFTKVYTSALKRSKESVQSFLDLGIPFESFAGLNEISWGTKEGLPITSEKDEFYHYMLKQWQEGNTSLKIERGESPEEVVARLKPVMEYILSKEDENPVLICMHGRSIRILLCYLLGMELKYMDSFEHKNLGLYLLDYKDSAFTIEKHNDVDHLRFLS